MQFKPHGYQQRAIDWILSHPASGLLLDMGLGKTVTTLTALDILINHRLQVGRVLVIAPLRVAATVWQEEAQKWDHLSGLRFSKILGDAKNRIAAIRAPADIYIINRQNVPWLVHYLSDLKLGWPFDCVVIDELSSFKSPSALRFRQLKKMRPYINRIIGLTGTPAPNGLLDLFPQIYLLDGGKRLGRTITGYRERYFTPGKRNGAIVCEWKPKPGSEAEIYAKLSDLCISMTAADYLTMPQRFDIVVPVSMGTAATMAYNRLEDDMILKLGGGQAITAASAAVVSNKLLQMANGAVYDQDRNVHKMHDAKLDALEDLIEAANGQPVLVYYTYQHDLERIKERFPEAVKIDGPEDVQRWNAGEIPILLAHPASAGHGLNLQQGGHICIWFGLTWSLQLYQQANARLYRQGQQNAVRIYHIVCEGTMDEQVMRILQDKDARQGALIDALKERVSK